MELSIIKLSAGSIKLQTLALDFSAEKFHNLCDNKGPSLTLIQTTNGNIFGGFTSASWESSGIFKFDKDAFIFSLDHQTKFPITNHFNDAIFCKAKEGPTFGKINISISDNSNVKKNSYISTGNEYSIPNTVNNIFYLTNGP